MEWVRDGKADRASIRLKASSGGNERLTKEHVSEWEEVEQERRAGVVPYYTPHAPRHSTVNTDGRQQLIYARLLQEYDCEWEEVEQELRTEWSHTMRRDGRN